RAGCRQKQGAEGSHVSRPRRSGAAHEPRSLTQKSDRGARSGARGNVRARDALVAAQLRKKKEVSSPRLWKPEGADAARGIIADESVAFVSAVRQRCRTAERRDKTGQAEGPPARRRAFSLIW